MAERRPSFPFYPKDWIASTRSMSGAARGYYLDMLAIAWLEGGCDADPEALRRSVGAERAEWRRVWPELAPRWQEVNGRLFNRKLEVVRAELDAFLAAKGAAGKASVEARRQKFGTASPSNRPPNTDPNSDRTEPRTATGTDSEPAVCSLQSASALSSDDDTTACASSPTAGQLRMAAVDLLGLWAQHGTGAPAPRFGKLNFKEKRDLWEALQLRSLDEWQAVFQRAAASDYLTGRDGQYPPMSFWRVLAAAGAIEAGEHDNRQKPTLVVAPPAPVKSKWDIDIDAVVAARRAELAAGRRTS